MKILVIGRSFPERETGMIGVFELDQAVALKKAGNELRYFFCDTRSIFRIQKIDKLDFEYQGILVSGNHLPIGRLPYLMFSLIKEKVCISHLKEVIFDFQPDVIHIHYPSIVLTEGIWEYIRSLDSAVVATEHFTKIMINQIPDRLRKLEACVVRESDGFICVSKKLCDSVEHISNIRGKITVIPNMVSGDFFISSANRQNRVIFTYVGAARKVKQVDKLVQAFQILQSTNSNSVLRIVGDGPELGKVKKLAVKLGITDCVEFYGNVSRDKVAGLLRETDYFVTASCLETFCVPVAEAWCCGIPTIISDQIPLLNYADKENSIIYKDSDVQSMAEAMNQAIEKRSTYDKKKIADTARYNFSTETVVQKLMEFYEYACERRKT